MELLEWLLEFVYKIVTLVGLHPYLWSSPAVDVLRRAASSAKTYKEWHEIQCEIDCNLDLDVWRATDASPYYDWVRIAQQKREIERCQINGDILNLCGMLRMHPVRNLYQILSPKLYNIAYGGTKILIEDYIHQVQRCVSDLAAVAGAQTAFDSQTKMELFHDTSHSIGRSTLVLQGGSAFSMCHIGIVKALHLQGLLPRIVTGTAMGALVAALLGIHPEHELLDVLTGEGLDLTAFEKSSNMSRTRTQCWQTIQRRFRRFLATGHLFNIRVLEQCAQDNLGDVTFEEAFAKTGRILNITVALSNEAGIPQLLNYITAPHVLVRSAVVASIATSKALYAPVQLFCKNETGYTEPYVATEPRFHLMQNRCGVRHRGVRLEETPLKRIGELFNVNHFIIAQTRPYLVPFLRAEQNYPGRPIFLQGLIHALSAEIFHMMTQLNTLGWLPTFICKLLMDETIPNTSRWAKITLVPDITLKDLPSLLETPSPHLLKKWILRGEQSAWPLVPELKVRCGIEFELDRAYEKIKRRTAEQILVDFNS